MEEKKPFGGGADWTGTENNSRAGSDGKFAADVRV
jgi:hypothetical protein